MYHVNHNFIEYQLELELNHLIFRIKVPKESVSTSINNHQITTQWRYQSHRKRIITTIKTCQYIVALLTIAQKNHNRYLTIVFISVSIKHKRYSTKN